MRRAVGIQLWRARRDVFSRRSAAKPAGWVRPDRICWSEPAIACSRRASPLSRQPPLIGRSCEGRTRIHRFDRKISLRANRGAGIRRVSPKTYATPALTMRAAANAGGSVAFSCGLRPSSDFSAFLLFFYHTRCAESVQSTRFSVSISGELATAAAFSENRYRPGHSTCRPDGQRDSPALCRRPPVAVKTERNARGEFCNRQRTGFQIFRVEHGEIAAVFGAAIEGREQITVALGGTLPARHEDRLGDDVARRQLINRALARFEIDMSEHVETVEDLSRAARGKKTVAIVEPGETLVESRKLGGEIVNCLALETVGVGGKVERPAGEFCYRLGRIAGPAIRIGE